MTDSEPPVELRKAGYWLALVVILLAAVLVRLLALNAERAEAERADDEHE